MLRWVEVNLGNIASNMQHIRKIVHKEAKIIATVKADGYGHGSVEISKVVLKNGADMLAVANVDEAEVLRRAGIKSPILLLNWTEPSRLKDIINYDLTQIIFDINFARALSKIAEKMNKTARVHVKIDTGMGRLGVLPKNAVQFVKSIKMLPGLEIEGIISHLANALDDKAYTLCQFKKFTSILKELHQSGIDIPIQHISNSIAILKYPQMHLTGVRPGIIIYGISPWGINKKIKFLKPAMSFKTRIASVKEVPKGTKIGYGCTFTTKRRSLIADIPVGYAQGYDRNLSNNSWVLVKGKRVPLIGRVCMDQCIIDTTEIAGVKPGDEVVLFGKQGKEEISAEELGSWTGTIGYEVVTTIGRLVPRVYVE